MTKRRPLKIFEDFQRPLKTLKMKRNRETKGKGCIVTEDITCGSEVLPIPVVNEIDDTTWDSEFTYSTFYHQRDVRLFKMTRRNVYGGQASCDCTDDCLNSSRCPCNSVRFTNAYRLEYTGNIINECSHLCRCKLDVCSNRVHQKGMTKKLEIFRTKKKGWGVRSLEHIQKGEIVSEYTGEVLTESIGQYLVDENEYLFTCDIGDEDHELHGPSEPKNEITGNVFKKHQFLEAGAVSKEELVPCAERLFEKRRNHNLRAASARRPSKETYLESITDFQQKTYPSNLNLGYHRQDKEVVPSSPNYCQSLKLCYMPTFHPISSVFDFEKQSFIPAWPEDPPKNPWELEEFRKECEKDEKGSSTEKKLCTNELKKRFENLSYNEIETYNNMLKEKQMNKKPGREEVIKMLQKLYPSVLYADDLTNQRLRKAPLEDSCFQGDFYAVEQRELDNFGLALNALSKKTLMRLRCAIRGIEYKTGVCNSDKPNNPVFFDSDAETVPELADENMQRDDVQSSGKNKNKNKKHILIDPKRIGNLGRFFNHSCIPNMAPSSYAIAEMIEYEEDEQQKFAPFTRLTLVAKRDIKPLTELTWNYGEVYIKASPEVCTCIGDKCRVTRNMAPKRQRKK